VTLEEYPFSPFCQIAKIILIPRNMVQCHLVNSFRYQIRNIRLVPYSLSSS
jgi:hypothetical protein